MALNYSLSSEIETHNQSPGIAVKKQFTCGVKSGLFTNNVHFTTPEKLVCMICFNMLMQLPFVKPISC